MSSVQDPIITTEEQEKRSAEAVANSLVQAGQIAAAADVVPNTPATPVTKSPEMKEAGAEVVGEDLSHIFGTTVGDLTYGQSKIRMTKSGRFLQMLKNKLLRKKNPDEDVVER